MKLDVEPGACRGHQELEGTKKVSQTGWKEHIFATSLILNFLLPDLQDKTFLLNHLIL